MICVCRLYRSSYHLTPASNRCLVLLYFRANFLRYQFQSLFEHAVGGLSLHHPVLMLPLDVVVFQVVVQIYLHLLYRLIPCCPPLDTEVFIQQAVRFDVAAR